MKTPGFDVELPPIDEDTPQKEILEGMLENYQRIAKNIHSVRDKSEELKMDCDNWTEEKLRTEFKRAMDTLQSMTDTLEYAYDHVRIVSILLRTKEE